MRRPPESWYRYRGRIIGVAVALLFAVLWMTIGLGRTIVVGIIVVLGYLIGAYLDGELDLDSWSDFFSRR